MVRLLVIVISVLAVTLSSCTTTKQFVIPETEQLENSEFIVFYDLPETSFDSSEMIFAAVLNDKSGWMNVEGEWKIPPEYDPGSFSQWTAGMVICSKNGKYGAINYQNRIIVDFEHDNSLNIDPDGLILVDRRNSEGYLETAYFNKEGKQVSGFLGTNIEFRNGIALITSNRTRLGRYPRHDSVRWSEIFTSDFALINTNFDTLLHIKKSPFLVEIGSLRSDRRSFILYPNLGLHADRGIDYGRYGYLDGNGNVIVEPTFSTTYALDQDRNEYDWIPDFPFVNNRALVEKADNDYAFIDRTGKEVFQLNSIEGSITYVSQFNDYGLAGVSSFIKENRVGFIHIIDTNGRVLLKENTQDTWLGLGPALRAPGNTIIPVNDRSKQKLRLYTPSFEYINTFSLEDSTYKFNYSYYDVGSITGDEPFYLTQERVSRDGFYHSQKRIISSKGEAITNWIDSKSVLSHKFGVYSQLDTTTNVNTLYDFNKNELYSCESCIFSEHDDRLADFGIFIVYHLGKNSKTVINYKGTVLSELFSSMDEHIVPFEPLIPAYHQNVSITLNFDESRLTELFQKSPMHDRIDYFYQKR